MLRGVVGGVFRVKKLKVLFHIVYSALDLQSSHHYTHAHYTGQLLCVRIVLLTLLDAKAVLFQLGPYVSQSA